MARGLQHGRRLPRGRDPDGRRPAQGAGGQIARRDPDHRSVATAEHQTGRRETGSAKHAAAKPVAEKPADQSKRRRSSRPRPAATEAADETGGYAVQLSGSPVEAEARAAATSLSAKYASALKGRHASFIQAKVGEKTIYRVRVGHLTEASAKDMCTAIKGQGGSCFVAKN